jgi:hypothetical protein
MTSLVGLTGPAGAEGVPGPKLVTAVTVTRYRALGDRPLIVVVRTLGARFTVTGGDPATGVQPALAEPATDWADTT